jgi:hypothetical protein
VLIRHQPCQPSAKSGSHYTRHLVVTLYILDGHHKIAAVAQAALAVQFLIFLPHTFLSRDQRKLVERGVTFLQGIAVGP